MRFNGKQVLITGRSGGAKVFSTWIVWAMTSVAAIAALPAPAGAQVLYGAGPAPNTDPSAAGPSYLYQIDPATAQVTQIGSIGFPYVRGMDVDPTDRRHLCHCVPADRRRVGRHRPSHD